MVLIGVLPHARHQNVSPGLGEHVGKFFCGRLHFRPLYENLNFVYFFHFFSSVSTNVDCGFTQMWVDDLGPKNGNFERLSPVQSLFEPF